MDIKTFLSALEYIGTSPYALIGYVVVAIIWGINLWKNHRIKIISEKLKDLPEKDRIKALELEYRLLPKGGLDAESYLKFNSKQNILIIVLVTIAAIVLIASLAVYKSVEENKLASAINTLSVALDVTKLARVSAKNNDFALAAGNLESVLALYPSAKGYMNLGYVYEEISSTDAALLSYRRALELEPSNPDIMNAIGYLYKDLGRFTDANKYLKDAVDNSNVGSEVWFMAMSNLGNVAYEIGRESNDIELRKSQSKIALKSYFLPALEYKGAITNKDFVAKTMANIGNCYKDIGDFENAEDYLTESLSIKRRLAASRSLADTLINMADLFLKQEKYKGAKPKIIEALSIFSITGNELGIGVGYFNLGDIHWALGETNEANNYYKRSVDSFSIANLGGEYEKAPRRRLVRMANNDLPEFVSKSWEKLGL